MAKAIAAEGKAEGRVSGNNSWPINELQLGDVYVADGFGKIVDGTLIGSNLGSADCCTYPHWFRVQCRYTRSGREPRDSGPEWFISGCGSFLLGRDDSDVDQFAHSHRSCNGDSPATWCWRKRMV